jgi:hypothetical protein
MMRKLSCRPSEGARIRNDLSLDKARHYAQGARELDIYGVGPEILKSSNTLAF